MKRKMGLGEKKDIRIEEIKRKERFERYGYIFYLGKERNVILTSFNFNKQNKVLLFCFQHKV